MQTELTQKQTQLAIKRRLLDLQSRGHLTRKGQPISLAAIGRTLDPEEPRQNVYQVVAGKRKTQKIRDAIERELGQPYWINKRAK